MSSRSNSHSHGVQTAKKRFEAALKGKTWAAPKKKKQTQQPKKVAVSKPKAPAAKKAEGVTGKKKKKATADDEEEEDDDDDGLGEPEEDAEQQEHLRMENMHQKAKVVGEMVGGWDPTIQDALFDLLQDEGVDAPGATSAVSTTDSPMIRLQKQHEREAAREAAETVNTILTGYVNCLIPAFGMSYLIDKN